VGTVYMYYCNCVDTWMRFPLYQMKEHCSVLKLGPCLAF